MTKKIRDASSGADGVVPEPKRFKNASRKFSAQEPPRLYALRRLREISWAHSHPS